MAKRDIEHECDIVRVHPGMFRNLPVEVDYQEPVGLRRAPGADSRLAFGKARIRSCRTACK